DRIKSQYDYKIETATRDTSRSRERESLVAARDREIEQARAQYSSDRDAFEGGSAGRAKDRRTGLDTRLRTLQQDLATAENNSEFRTRIQNVRDKMADDLASNRVKENAALGPIKDIRTYDDDPRVRRQELLDFQKFLAG